MRVVVTGGAGFIGSHCVDLLLSRGHDVVVVDNFSSGLRENLASAEELARRSGRKLEVIEASISDPQLWEKRLAPADALFHLAAQTSVTVSVKDPIKDFRTNVEPVLLLLAWLRRQSGCRVVYANTAGALYGDAESLPTDERQPVKPVSPYGATKAFFETYLGAMTASLKAEGIWSSDPKAANFFSWTALRLANVYGPRQRTKGEAGVVPIFIEKLASGESPLVFGKDEATRDYVHVADVAAAFMASLDRMTTVSLDDSYNVASSTETSALEVFDLVLDALRVRANSEGGAQGKLRSVLGAVEPVHQGLRPGEVRRSSLSNLKAKSFLDWKPVRNFEDGIRETVATYPL